MDLSLSEETYSKEFYRVYTKYGNDIPDAEWQRLGEMRERYGIEKRRVRKIMNAVMEGTYVPVLTDTKKTHGTAEKPKEKSMASIFTSIVSGMKSRHNGTDCLLIDISDSVKSLVRSNFELGLDELILWVRDTSWWGSKNQGLVITDKQIVHIPDNDNPDKKYCFEFNDIHHAEYREMSIFIWDYEEQYVSLPVGAFFKESEESSDLIRDAKRLAEALTEMAKFAGHTETKTVFDELDEYIRENQLDAAEDLVKQAISSFEDAETQCLSYTYLAHILYEKGKSATTEKSAYMKDAIDACDEALALCKDDDSFKFTLYKEKGIIEEEVDNLRIARNCFIAAMESNDYDLKKEAKEQYGQLMERLLKDKNLFMDIDYNDRKLLCTVGNEKQISGCRDAKDNIKWVFSVNRIPGYLNFPVGHPQPNTLYIGHPIKVGTYLPFEDSTEQLFMEKIRELCYLAQCLGAVEIRFKKIKGRDISQSDTTQTGISAEGEKMLVKAGVNINTAKSKTKTSSDKNGVELVQRYSPTERPFCPKGLVWLDSDPTWQTLVKQRLTGNILSYVERVSSTTTTTVSTNELLSVKGSFECIMVKASASFDRNKDTTFSKTDEMEWEIDMQFKPLQDFEDNALSDKSSKTDNISNSEVNSSEEQDYMDEVRFCLEDDNEINERTRRFLDRKRQKCGLSEARAKELEAMVMASLSASTKQDSDDVLSEEEQAYKDDVELCMEDGNEIDEPMRKFLERKRQRLGLSEARAKEIEATVKATQNPFTKEEQEYMEILDDVIEDGVIPNSVRRLLDREIKSLGLSKQRAKELEELKCK